MFPVAHVRVVCFMVQKKLDDEENEITAVNLKLILIPFQCCFLCLYHKYKYPIYLLMQNCSLTSFGGKEILPFKYSFI